jgi:O-antigen ligase/polysaccharide polymerase Wzy-like membrane protein
MLRRTLCVLLFLAWTAEAANDTVVYCGLWRSPFEFFAPLFASIPGISLFPWQILVLVLAPVCVLRPAAFRNRSGLMDAAIVVSFASIAVTFFWGWARGGSAYNAYYQLWRFLVALLIGLMLLSVIRTAKDLKGLGLTVLAAAVVRGGLAIYFYWAHVQGKLQPPPQYMTTHDDTLLFVAGLLIVLSWALARMRSTAWLGAALVSVHLLYAITLNNRRLAWIELLLVLALVYALLPKGGVRRRVNRFMLVAAPIILVYAAVGWGRQGAIFEPLRALSTSGSDADASSLARLEEIRNLMYTLAAAGNPLLGTGWGLPYQAVTNVYAHFGPDWWQYQYMPHNSLLGVVAFGGLVGIFGIWLVVPATAFLGTRGYRSGTGSVERAASMAAVGILPAYGAQCYGDIGFQSFTCGLLLGVAMGVAGKVAAWTGPPPPARAPRAEAP